MWKKEKDDYEMIEIFEWFHFMKDTCHKCLIVYKNIKITINNKFIIYNSKNSLSEKKVKR